MSRDVSSETPPGRLAAWRPRAAGFAVWYLRIAAVLNFFGAVSAPFRSQVSRHNTGDFFTPYMLSAGFTSGALALFLAMMMRRRKRAAWIWNTVVGGLYAVLMVLLLAFAPEVREHWFNWISTTLTVLLLVALLVGRREFRAKGDRSNPRLALGVLIGGGAIGVAVGTALVALTNTAADSSFGVQLRYALLRVYTLAPSGADQRGIDTPHWVDIAINVMSALILVLVLYALSRSPKGKEYLCPQDELQLRALLDRHGERDSLGYFALRRDKSVVFSPSGKAAVVYRVVGAVSLASGDPIGDVEAWPGAIDRWLDQAREHAWIPAVMGAGEEGGTVYARHGLNALELGDEAVVEVDEFTLEGRAMRGVRQAHKKVGRAGYTVRVRRHADIPDAEMDLLLQRADQWRDGQTERGFSMALGRLGDPDDGQCVMLECHDGQGELRALLSFVPWGREGLSLDLMRRDRDSDNGLLEFMVIELIGQAEAVGVKRVSLNFAMFRAVFERGGRLGAGPVLRMWRSVLIFLSRWWQIESLYRANAKYRPIWEPRYLLFSRSSDLPRIGMASARAEGFITAPSLPSLFKRRHVRALEKPAEPLKEA
ncbi:phosphatidylglycerol lysyltransferase domain-containing protein [Streptacidiphilus cavernicola]|uniref:Phosphatidylglycerol lysyltransferase domain-containing protein n=1 Tax=Streptacidiphilus cavernicola TaxID=3342716 RepID=A0ABV6VN64_9ACTN